MTESRDELTPESLRAQADQAGLSLTDEEAASLVKGVQRNREMAQRLRELIRPETEPRPVFHAPISDS